MNKELISFAETAALSAGKIILGSTNNIKVDFKGKTDLITNIDLESERSIIDKIIKSHPSHNILSEENGLINNPYLLNNPTIWPKKVIVMMLHRVGSTNGIDFKQLKNIIKLNNNSEIYVAGGIQNFSDINNLNSMNVRGCLVATSLHKNKITKDELDLHFNS